jgi:hypothetical protein
MKSERLKKLEVELKELEQIISIGIYPKRDLQKGLEEIRMLKAKIDEELERLRLLKENGDADEYSIPKRGTRQAYAEPHTLPDMEMEGNMTDSGIDNFETEQFEMTETGDNTETAEFTTTAEGETSEEEEEELEEDIFSDSARAKRFGRMREEEFE